MPIDPSISLGVQAPQMPNLLDLALRGQALQNQRLQGQGLQQNLTAQNAIGQIIQKNTNPDGSVDNAGVQRDIASNPDAAFLAQSATGTNLGQTAQQIQNQSSQFKLHNDYATVANQTAAGLLVDPRINGANPNQPYNPQQAAQALSEAQEAMVQKGVPREQALTAVAPFAMAVHQPGQVQQMLKNVVMGSQSAPQQMATVTPQVTMTPTIGANGQPVEQPTNVNPNAGPIGPIAGSTAQPMTMAPGALDSIETDALGNKHIVSRSAGGAILATRPMPGATGPQNAVAGAPGFVTLTPGQGSDIASAQQEVQGVRSAADQVPVQHNINQQILKLSQDTASGPGSQQWHNVLSGLSLGQFGDNYQELGKYLEKNALANMQSMGGPPSDARLSAASAANGSTLFNPGALQAVTKFNDATSSALGMYRQGMDHAVGLQNSDYTALPAFKSAWAKNLDINIFRLQNAMQAGDTNEIDKIKNELGTSGMKSLAQKYLNLQSLSQTGRLPPGQ